MPCLTPLTLYVPERKANDNHTNVVPCGKCPHCKQQRSYAWQFRLQMEEKISSSSCFITLTYENPPLSYNKNPNLQKKDCQDFFKRLRKKLLNQNIKYYLVGEYGTQTQRPHYHAIIFNLPQLWLTDPDKILNTWGHGIIQIDLCEKSSIAYVCNYINKSQSVPSHELDDRTKEFSLMSKKMGLNHLTPQMVKHYRTHLSDTIIHSGGSKSVLPRYFKEKIFTADELRTITAKNKYLSEEQFETRFNNSFKEQLTWKKDQYRKQEKSERLKAQKL